MIRRILLAGATGLASLGLLVAPQLTPKAEAYQTSSSAVGTINGYYQPSCGTSCGRAYFGTYHPIAGGRCVEVQRLLGNNTWTSAYVNDGGGNCSSGYWESWSITNVNAVSGTYAIRLIVYFDASGAYEGRTVRWCGYVPASTSGKNQCLARR